jgi:hypothetical protein
MNPDTNDSIDLIDLGVASDETKGGGKNQPDVIDFQLQAGLTDD